MGSSDNNSVTRLAFIPMALALAGAILPAPAASLNEINPPPRSPAQKPLAIVGATLLDGRGGPPVQNAVVVVLGEKIIAAGPRQSVSVPDGAATFDATG